MASLSVGYDKAGMRRKRKKERKEIRGSLSKIYANPL